MARSAQPEECPEFRHWNGKRMSCHRPKGHRGEHHTDYGLRWSRNPNARRTRMADDPCPDCEPLGEDETERARLRR